MRSLLFPVLAGLLHSGCSSSSPPPDQPFGLALLQEGGEGRKFTAFLERSVRESELFRRRLLSEGSGGSHSQAELLARAIQDFCRTAEPRIDHRPSLEEFQQVAKEIPARIAGQGRISGPEVYGKFSGEWHGLWTDFPVDHQWGGVEVLNPPLAVSLEASESGAPESAERVWIRSWQYAWVGDGYGLNLVAASDPGEGGKDFLIGYVVHLKDRDFKREMARRPHVGVAAGPGKIIWMTAGEVFLEERLRLSSGEEAYAITGFFYRLEESELEASEGFQAVYTRRPENRPAWSRFPISLRVNGGSVAEWQQNLRRGSPRGD